MYLSMVYIYNISAMINLYNRNLQVTLEKLFQNYSLINQYIVQKK